MTEVPEHLLQRAKAARARMTGGEAPSESAASGGASSSDVATTVGDATPAVAEAPRPAKIEPKLPWVEAGEARRKIPVWAVSVLAFLPIWAIFYMTTNDKPTSIAVGPISEGLSIYGSKCASCHGPSGGGGVGPQLSSGNVLKTFTKPESQVRWVLLGTEGFKGEKTATYGDAKKPVGGSGAAMPGWSGTITPDELLSVVRHERETLSGEKFNAADWDEVAKLATDPNPLVSGPAKEFKAIIDHWKTLPPGS